MWLPLPTDIQVALTPLKLGTATSFSYVSHLFDVSKATNGEATLEVHRALRHVLGHMVLQVHNPLVVVVAEFHALGFLQCFRALDGTHIPITGPPLGNQPYYSQRGFHSVVSQAIVDHQGAFMHTRAG
ncbi:hypothetical protein Y1Q_0022676 [Alligator mississippiensis]|uniref:DDE Tnp4 domain-containing protein n=1 Tax=Alligator mississippiensis TaxID=8496 RepID=A0A151PH83_ALLMI|nr:hypothetical protein Y1Q_0022676 [Alligator mississippiensis]